MIKQNFGVESQLMLNEIFFSDGLLLTFSKLKVPKTAIRSAITTQLFLFFSTSAQLSQFATFGLSVCFIPAPLFLSLSQCFASFARPHSGTAFLLFIFVLDFYKKSHAPVLPTAVIVYCSRCFSVACVRTCIDTFIVVFIDQQAMLSSFC